MKTIRHRSNRDPDDDGVLKIVTDGGFILVTVGRHNRTGARETVIQIMPLDEARGGDDSGRAWLSDGPTEIHFTRIEPPKNH